MATGMDAYEEAVTPFKLDLLRDARFEGGGEQSVLDIGIGAAPNLQYLTRASFQQVDYLQEGAHLELVRDEVSMSSSAESTPTCFFLARR